MAALQYVNYKNYHALFVRPDRSNLEIGVMRSVLRWLDGTSVKNEKGLTWIFPSGARFTFGYFANKRKIINLLIKNSNLSGVTTLRHLREKYLKLFSFLYPLPRSFVPLRILSTGNAFGTNPKWVKERFIIPSQQNVAKFNRYRVSVSLDENPYVKPAGIRKNLDPWIH